MIALSCLFYISIQLIQERDLSGIKSNFIVMNHGNDKFLKNKDVYVNKVIEFIQIHYSHKISISELAESIHLDSKYLSAIFKDVLGVPIREYILNYRINKACELMKDKRLSIGDIARSTGYDDRLLFSRMFKKVKGASPRQFRNGQ